MYCPHCGVEAQEEDEFCYRCGQRIQIAVAAVEKPTPTPVLTSPPTVKEVGKEFAYAGFWRRFFAWIIDILILGVISRMLSIIIWLGPTGVWPETLMTWTLGTFEWLLKAFVGLLYFAVFESSVHQATPGKMVLNIIVTNLSGQRISFGRAVARDLSKIFSILTLGIGFLIIGFTEEKRGLHDFIANTLVIRK